MRDPVLDDDGRAAARYAEKSLPALRSRNLVNVTASIDPAAMFVYEFRKSLK